MRVGPSGVAASPDEHSNQIQNDDFGTELDKIIRED